MPQRIQMRRSKGWRKPAGVIYVGRPTCWGNPYRVGRDGSAIECVEKFERLCALKRKQTPGAFREWIAPLRSHDLACWCPVGAPCHADVLLEMANANEIAI